MVLAHGIMSQGRIQSSGGVVLCPASPGQAGPTESIRLDVTLADLTNDEVSEFGAEFGAGPTSAAPKSAASG